MTMFKRIICLLIAFMLIIPAIPGRRADAAEVFNADTIYKKNIHFTSTNKQSNLQGFWQNGNKVSFAISILDAKNIVSAEYTTSGVSKTVSGSAIQHFDVTSIKVKDKNNDDQITEFTVEKPQNQKFAIISFTYIEIEDDFDLDIEIDNGEGHEFGGPIRLIESDDDVVGGGDGNGDNGDGGEPGDDDGKEPGDDDGKEPGDDYGGEPGDDNGGESGDDDGKEPGDDDGKEPGDDDGKEPGDDDGGEPGDDDDGEPGDDDDGEPGDDDDGERGDDDGKESTDKKDNKTESRSTGGGGGGGTIIASLAAPLAELEKSDHFAYIIGYPEGTVKALDKITRQEVAVIFYRLLTDESRTGLLSEINSFSDMDSGSWSNKAVSTLLNGNIIKGYPDGTFRPEAPITRAEFATIAAKFDNLDSGNQSKFTDISGHWAVEYITSSEIKGWIKGYPDLTFKPDEDITRAEAISLINNVLERSVPAVNIHPEAVLWTDLEKTEWFYSIIMEATYSHDYITEENGDELWTGLKANKVWP